MQESGNEKSSSCGQVLQFSRSFLSTGFVSAVRGTVESPEDKQQEVDGTPHHGKKERKEEL